ncbi:sugar ABC transporter ATP-binding protein [Anoxybacter fermentans]|uniref:Sugar ABC transporter ATP-binding protein n=1 Tax=Anoxybacter fermentans TaxID=1323375 RepID=A0A3S9T1H8_9FIRM|nr:ATP-binding cassette domain-containing protein [Anoxybacter fermentans]AZR74380.1 sugar ABC transporter ATP-binding protein [Anoxybacter fermentans]
MNVIEVKDLKRYFTIYKRPPGITGIFKSMIKPKRIIKKAVDGISFNVTKGEIVGILGPNGAGKSTTIKMLTGILVPTEGIVRVNGREPFKNRIKNAMEIGVVFGQRTQLWWNLPLRESFDLIRTIYKIPTEIYNKNYKIFSEILELDRFIDTPVRQLSLGQRMRAEIGASLLHNPKIVFFDEPTIGLDVVAKQRIREFIKRVNEKSNVTVILTTHDMGDIEKLCDRIIIIDNGKIIYDGSINKIKEIYAKERVLVVDFEIEPVDFELTMGRVIKEEGTRKHILFNRDECSAPELVNYLSAKYSIKDFMLKETDIEHIIGHIYEHKFK